MWNTLSAAAFAGRRGLRAAVAVACTLGLGTLASGAAAEDLPPPAPFAAGPDVSQQLSALRSAPCPHYRQASYSRIRPGHATTALRGTFYILGRPVRLVPPVNWAQDPYNSRQWTQTLHQWDWMAPLLAPYRREGNPAALRRARDLALDWIRNNPFSTWKDKVTADRAGYLAYLIRAAACRRLLDDRQATTLVQSAYQHGEYLADPANHGKGNHGLYVDAGLRLLTGYLPHLPRAGEWRALALTRFKAALQGQVSAEGVDLEHSPAYQFKVYDLVSRFLTFPGAHDPAIERIAARMRLVAGWFVMPDGLVTRLGDTGYIEAPRWARSAAAHLRGLAPTFNSGFGIVKLPGAYLSVADALWDFPHSQSDQLTFELWDRGRRIVTDTGRYTGTRNPAAAGFSDSAEAHNVLIVDGQDFRKGGTASSGDRDEPQGSWLTGRGQGADWYAIEGRNRLVERLGVQHDRLFLYRPGQALVVVDRVRSPTEHSYTRLFQFAPDLTARASGRALPLSGAGLRAWLYDAPSAGEKARLVVRARRDPLLGWTNAPTKLQAFRPRTAVALQSHGASLQHVAVIGLGGIARAWLVSDSEAETRLRISLPGRAPATLTLRRAGARLVIR